MTQQPYQPPPQQGWPQQPPPYGTPPQGPPPGYPQQPPAQQWPPAGGVPQGVPEPGAPNPFNQAGPAGAPPSDDAFGDPGEGTRGNGDSPALHQLVGRLILFKPVQMDRNATQYKSTELRDDVMICHIVVCDGEPIPGNVNGETNQFTPFAAGPKVAPFYIGSIQVRSAVSDKLQDYLKAQGMCLARLVERPSRAGKPWKDLAPATEQDKALARTIVPRWDELKALAQPVQPQDPYGSVQGGQLAPPPGYAQAPGQPYPGQPYQQGPPPGYPAQNPQGAPPAQPPYYPQQPAPQGWPQQPPY